MPQPESGETERDFLKRCIPQMVHEGRQQNQSVAACFSIYRKSGTGTKSPKPERKAYGYEHGEHHGGHMHDHQHRYGYEHHGGHDEEYHREHHDEYRGEHDHRHRYDSNYDYKHDHSSRRPKHWYDYSKKDKVKLFLANY
jgi:hypothetical protein